MFSNFGDFWRKSVPRGPKQSDKKSRDFSFKNPGIPGIPLGPDYGKVIFWYPIDIFQESSNKE